MGPSGIFPDGWFHADFARAAGITGRPGREETGTQETSFFAGEPARAASLPAHFGAIRKVDAVLLRRGEGLPATEGGHAAPCGRPPRPTIRYRNKTSVCSVTNFALALASGRYLGPRARCKYESCAARSSRALYASRWVGRDAARAGSLQQFARRPRQPATQLCARENPESGRSLCENEWPRARLRFPSTLEPQPRYCRARQQAVTG